VVDVPIEFRAPFENDIMGALRDIAGIATMARHPFIMNSEAVTRAFGAVPSIFNRESVDFVQTRLSILKARFHEPHLPRFAHVDLALTGDSAGVAIGHVTGFKAIQRSQENQKQTEPMPEILDWATTDLAFRQCVSE
jgi:hypothetical protein